MNEIGGHPADTPALCVTLGKTMARRGILPLEHKHLVGFECPVPQHVHGAALHAFDHLLRPEPAGL